MDDLFVQATAGCMNPINNPENRDSSHKTTEDTEMMRFPHIFPVHIMGEVNIYIHGNHCFCELGDESPIPANPIASVNSVYSVVN